MAKVWEVSQHSGTQLLMLLAIADFADDDGIAWPSVATLARKCRVKARNAGLLLAALRASGELDVLPNAGPQGVNRYRVTCMSPLQKSAPPLQSSAVPPLQPATSPPCIALQGSSVEDCMPPLQPATDKPSMNLQPTTKGTTKRAAAPPLPCPSDVSAQVWSDWLVHRRSKGAAVTHTVVDGIRREATKAGWALEDALRECSMRNWQGLKAEWLMARTSKTALGRPSFKDMDYSAGLDATSQKAALVLQRLKSTEVIDVPNSRH